VPNGKLFAQEFSAEKLIEVLESPCPEQSGKCFVWDGKEVKSWMQLVWFKGDLRREDHVALVEAAARGPVLPLYILEPELWKQPDLSQRQYLFLTESLSELDSALQSPGQGLIIKVGDTVDILRAIHQRHTIQGLWSHQETWNGWTYNRDKRVRQWTKENAIPWHEETQYGVIRCLKNRDYWASRWHGEMKKPVPSSPETLQVIDETSDVLPSAQELGLLEDGCVMRQKGGRGEGLKLLPGFLHERSESYTKKCHRPLQHLTAVPVYQLILPLEHSLCERYFSPLKSAFMKLKTCHVARRENGQVLCGLFREDYVGTAILSRSWKMSRALNLRICILPMMVLEKVTLMKHIMRHGKQVKQDIRWWMRACVC